jgi:hypothetical protein
MRLVVSARRGYRLDTFLGFVSTFAAGLLLARSCLDQTGRACPLCPGKSDLDLFRYGESVVDFDAEITHGALNFCMPE